MSILDVLADGIQDTEWHRQAACVGMDGFVPPPVGSDEAKTWARNGWADALQVCRTCPVRRTCGEWARSHDITFGVWGGHLRGKGPDNYRRGK